MELTLSPKERFNALDLEISWKVLGDLDRSDLDALIDEKKLGAVIRAELVSLWRDHPNKSIPQGKIN